MSKPENYGTRSEEQDADLFRLEVGAALVPTEWRRCEGDRPSRRRRTTKVNDFAKSKPIEWFERAA
ncbi:hypothetical protein [Bradyrhizobium sp. CCBAU 45384]|uniref:hypothetical protein n=1 Tax=Bradyrhizobium sp. CCBAU 45384 TaxID=858428 RepID=UPI0023067C2F|nr:hypothetical protein [Bradyrhizobium sp. CCBAU 45384]MDA9411522.1 hypothetical protein [Bradyrhizobium sp. CCBAU 45384]